MCGNLSPKPPLALHPTPHWGFGALKDRRRHRQIRPQWPRKMKDMQRGQNNPVLDLYTVLNDFSDQRTGKKFSPVDSWGNDRVPRHRQLGALTNALQEMVIGTNPSKTHGRWGIVQQTPDEPLANSPAVPIPFHPHRPRRAGARPHHRRDKAHALPPGEKNHRADPQPFSDVIYNPEKCLVLWDTANSQNDVKPETSPSPQKLPADFRPILRWENRKKAGGGVMGGEPCRSPFGRLSWATCESARRPVLYRPHRAAGLHDRRPIGNLRRDGSTNSARTGCWAAVINWTKRIPPG